MWARGESPAEALQLGAEGGKATLLGLGEQRHWKDPDGDAWKGGPPVLAQVISGEHSMLWTAVDGNFSSVRSAMHFVEQATKRKHFVLGVLRDRRNGRVTKIEPGSEAAA